jgi:DME family drug/metabolite transporter
VSQSILFPGRVTSALGARASLIQISLAGVLWGTTGVVVQLVRQATELSPVTIGFYRLAIAAVVLLALVARQIRPMIRALRSAPLVLVLTGVGLGAYQALYFVAVALAGVSVATVVSLGLAPVLIAGWEAARARRVPGPITLGTLAAGVAGLVLITVSTSEPTAAAPRPLLGLLAAIGCGIGYAASTVLSRHASGRVTPMALTTVSTTIGALALAPFALVSGVTFAAGAAPVAMLGYLGVVTTALAYALFYAGLRTTTGSAAAVLTLLEPLAAALLAVLVLAEPLPALAIVGGLLLLGAITALYLEPEPARPAVLPEAAELSDAVDNVGPAVAAGGRPVRR